VQDLPGRSGRIRACTTAVGVVAVIVAVIAAVIVAALEIAVQKGEARSPGLLSCEEEPRGSQAVARHWNSSTNISKIGQHWEDQPWIPWQ